MNLTSPPNRVFAIVVGIEEYEGGSQWQLRGPGLDAIRFARWLLVDRKVPATNIQLFANFAPAKPKAPKEREKVLAELAAKKLTPQEPTQKSLMQVLYGAAKRAPFEKGGLIVFWSGHGAASDRTQDRDLFCSDATEEFGHAINVTDLTERWRVTPQFSKFQEQWVIVDACAQWLSELSVLPFSAPPPFPPGRVHVVQQSAMYASPAGRLARTEASRASSVFTNALLDALPKGDWPDLAKVWATLDERLKGDEQSPVVEWRTPSGPKFIGPGAEAGARALVEKLDGVPNGWIHRAFVQAMANNAPAALPPSFVDAVRRLEALVESKDKGTLTPVEKFLLRLTKICRDEGNNAAAETIDKWLNDHTTDKPGLTTARQALAQPRPGIATLRLWIPASDSPSEIRAMLDIGGETKTWVPPPESKSTAAVMAGAREFAQDEMFAIPVSQRPQYLAFELRLPGRRLMERLETIEIEGPGLGAPDLFKLCDKHMAVLRIVDRAPTSDYRLAWDNAWLAVSKRVEAGELFEVEWVEEQGDRNFDKHDFRQFPWIGFTFAAADSNPVRNRPLFRALGSGAPLVIWPSQDPPPEAINEFKSGIVARLRGSKLTTLIDDLVTHHRCAGAISGSVIFDRPTDGSELPDLKQPQQKGTE
jgi:hypothetical protein